jgi:CRISPR system Cascade subunit CasC
MPFGGAVRTRISSQCLKRHWRVFDGDNSLKDIRIDGVHPPRTIRSRISFQERIVKPLVDDDKIPENVALAAAIKIMDKVFGSEAKKERAERNRGKGKSRAVPDAVADDVASSPTPADTAVGEASQPPGPLTGKAAKTEQVTVLGEPELNYLLELARDAVKEGENDIAKVEKALDRRMNDKDMGKNIQALKLGAGLGAALFGRMVTGDFLADTHAAIHVAHAVTVHSQMTESDYFSAIDELIREKGEQGSGHINASELTSGLFYGYVVVDIDGLVRNLGDDRKLAADVVEKLVHIIAKVSPGAKLGSTAPYAYSHLVLVEGGRSQPRTLQNAFLEPVRTQGNVVQNAGQALAEHLGDLDRMYGQTENRVHAGLGKIGKLFEDKSAKLPEDETGKPSGQGIVKLSEDKESLSKLAEWAKQQVLAGESQPVT